MTRRTFGAVLAAILMSVGLRAKPSGYHCPRCYRLAHYTCPNLNCTCWKHLKPGELPLVRIDDDDGLACPYCGFAAHIDYWCELEMSQAAQEVREGGR